MADREMVVKGLESLHTRLLGAAKQDPIAMLDVSMVADALSLLKEQETTSTAKSRLFHCEKCGYGIDDIYLSNEYDFDVYPHYCPNCGRHVKWE